MRDTTPRAEAHYWRLMAGRTPAERVEMACGMFEAARELACAGIIMQHGAQGEAHMRKYLFLRFYGRDFDEEKKRRILASWGEALT
jgi:hypothetical protein